MARRHEGRVLDRPAPGGCTEHAREDALLRAVLDSASNHMVYQDREGRFRLVTASAAEDYGVAPEDMAGRTWQDLGLRSDMARAMEELRRQALSTGRVQRAGLRPQDIGRCYEHSVAPVLGAGGEAEGTIAMTVDVTELRQLGELKEDDERLRALINATGDPMFIKDREGRYLMANPAALRNLNWSAEDVLGKDDTAVQLDAGIARDVMASDRRIMDTDTEETVEEAIRTPRGDRTYLSTKTPLHDQHGRVVGIVGTARDITARKRTEEALRESEAKYRGLFEHMQDLVAVLRYVLDEKGEVVDWSLEDANPPALRYMGAASLRDVDRMRLSELVNPADLASFAAITNFVRQDAVPFVHDRHIERTSRDFILTYIPLDRERFILTGTDITDIKSAQRRLDEERARLRAIIDTLPVGITIADPTGRIVELNRMAEQIWGFGANGADTYGDQMRWRAGSEEPLKERARLLARALRGETIINEEYDIDRADGAVGTVIASGAPVRDARGKVIGALSTVVDITERRKLENELAEAKSRAETYVDVLTHDVNNYNTAAMGFLQLAEMRLGLDEQRMRYISRPLEVLEDSSELIANVRDLQRLEAGRDAAGKVDLCRMLKEVKEAYEDPPGREVEINLYAPDHCAVLSSTLLRNAFSNIVSNAIKHSSGPLEINIRLDFQTVGGKEGVRVSFEDNGPGISDARKKVIFDRNLMGLTRTVSRGLGLYLVKRLVEDLGGEVWAEDRVKGDHTQGARFVVLLPGRQAKGAGGNGKGPPRPAGD